VIDADGAPVPSARIVIVSSTVPVPEIALLSDADGRFALRLPRGHFTLRAHGSNDAVGEAEVEGPPQSGEIVITIDH
jgi:hypothetical protein